jgi:hypothetical protein
MAVDYIYQLITELIGQKYSQQEILIEIGLVVGAI